jgi:hypothetical protein
MTTTLEPPQSTVATPDAARPASSPVTLVTRVIVPMGMVLATFVAMMRTAAAPLSNPDTFFHLRFGSEFLDGWSLRHPGHVSSYSTADWAPTQWLPQELMAQLDRWFGLPGVAWFAGFQFLALALSVYLVARRWSDRVVAAPVLVVVMLACAPGLSMRPQVLSYLAAVLLSALWVSVRHAPRLSWWRAWSVVPFVWFWAMCHGMWPLGVVVSLAAVVGMIFDGKVRGRAAAVMLTIPFVAGLAAGLLTPVGSRLLPAVLVVNSRASYFTEWAPPNFHNPNCLALLLILLVTVLVMVRRGADWTSIALVGVATVFAHYSARTVPVAACLLVPVAAQQLQGLLGDVRRQRSGERWMVIATVVAALAVLAVLVPSTSKDTPPEPSWVPPTLSALPDGTRIMNEQVFGGYLMYRYPQLDFLFSGYGDAYTTAELKTMSKINDLEPGWDDLVREADPAYAFLDPQTPLAYELTQGQGWTVVKASKDVELLAPPVGWMDPTS